MVVCSAIVVLVACGSTRSTDSAPSPLQFTGTTVDGGTFDGRTLEGKPAVIWFWASWCPVCASQAPAVAGMAKQLAGTDVAMIGIAGLGSALSQTKDFVAESKLGGFPQIIDITGNIWNAFGVKEQASFGVVHRDGTVEMMYSPVTVPDVVAKARSL